MEFQLVGTYEKVGYKFGRYIDTQWWALFVGEDTPKKILPLENILGTDGWEEAVQKGMVIILV